MAKFKYLNVLFQYLFHGLIGHVKSCTFIKSRGFFFSVGLLRLRRSCKKALNFVKVSDITNVVLDKFYMNLFAA